MAKTYARDEMMKLTKNLETERLILRTLTVADITEMYVGWLNDPEINAFLEVRLATQTIESTRALVASLNDSPDSLMLGIFLKEDGGHLGNIKLGPVNPYHRRGDIGLFIGKREYWGMGIATEAIKVLSEHCLGEMKLHKICAGCYAENTGSVRAFLKAGFFEEGRRQLHWLCEGAWQDDIELARIKKAEE
jgi:ribosomal-protein-alanine N-acetyltransferase